MFQIYLGADQDIGSTDEMGYSEQWQQPQHATELIIHRHFKFKKVSDLLKNKRNRKDFDIALVRISYPVLDEQSGRENYTDACIIMFILGMTILPEGKFSPHTLMPICLPSSSNFQDTERGKNLQCLLKL